MRQTWAKYAPWARTGFHAFSTWPAEEEKSAVNVTMLIKRNERPRILHVSCTFYYHSISSDAFGSIRLHRIGVPQVIIICIQMYARFHLVILMVWFCDCLLSVPHVFVSFTLCLLPLIFWILCAFWPTFCFWPFFCLLPVWPDSLLHIFVVVTSPSPFIHCHLQVRLRKK